MGVSLAIAAASAAVGLYTSSQQKKQAQKAQAQQQKQFDIQRRDAQDAMTTSKEAKRLATLTKSGKAKTALGVSRASDALLRRGARPAPTTSGGAGAVTAVGGL